MGDGPCVLIFRRAGAAPAADLGLLRRFAEEHGFHVYLQEGGDDSIRPLPGQGVNCTTPCPRYGVRDGVRAHRLHPGQPGAQPPDGGPRPGPARPAAGRAGAGPLLRPRQLHPAAGAARGRGGGGRGRPGPRGAGARPMPAQRHRQCAVRDGGPLWRPRRPRPGCGSGSLHRPCSTRPAAAPWRSWTGCRAWGGAAGLCLLLPRTLARDADSLVHGSAIGWSAPGRWTCSRIPRMSSPWRCSSALGTSMAIEIERKFLVNDPSWREAATGSAHRPGLPGRRPAPRRCACACAAMRPSSPSRARHPASPARVRVPHPARRRRKSCSRVLALAPLMCKIRHLSGSPAGSGRWTSSPGRTPDWWWPRSSWRRRTPRSRGRPGSGPRSARTRATTTPASANGPTAVGDEARAEARAGAAPVLLIDVWPSPLRRRFRPSPGWRWAWPRPREPGPAPGHGSPPPSASTGCSIAAAWSSTARCPIPSLATWERLTPTRYRFTLGAEGRAFADGTRHGPDDVVATYASILDPATASPHRALLGIITSLGPRGRTGWSSQLREPDPLFPAYPGLGIPCPADPRRARGSRRGPLGSGAFALAAWPGPGRLRLTAAGTGGPSNWWTVKDPNVRVMKLLRGEVQMLQGDLSPELRPIWRAAPG